jgi:uncharacterized protein YceH (UPF0502 family)
VTTMYERRALDPVEGRVLGVLVEKQMTTPDNYPLTLAGVVAGCNQSTNRQPVMSFDDGEVEKALVRLHDLGLATPVRRSGDRSTKYRHKLGEAEEIDDRAQAILAVLLLRGPQTGGELRTRTERYVSFDSVQEVEEVVDRLEEGGLARRLPRSPGQSQRRVTQLLSGEETGAIVDDTPPGVAERVSELERRFSELLERLGVDDL